jgi:hypothetical protein
MDVLAKLPSYILEKYEVKELRHSVAILKSDFPNEYGDIIDMLTDFKLKREDVLTAGGRKSPIADKLDAFLYSRGWSEKKFDTEIVIDGKSRKSPTHKIDCYKNRVALDIEWNNKDPFFDRDLNNYRLLFDLGAISVGVIVTRASDLQNIFNSLDKGSSYGNSTTHMNKLVQRIDGGSGGGCPLLVFGITHKIYEE